MTEKGYITISKESGFENKSRKKPKKQSFKNNSTDMTKLNDLIYTRTKLVSDKIGIPQGNANRNKFFKNVGWEMSLEGQIKKLRKPTKEQRKEKYTGNEKNEKRQQQTKLTIQQEEINQMI